MIHFPFHHRVRNRLRRTFARDLVVAYRHRGLRPEDVVLACYPKSGSTWLTFMLAQLLWQAGREQTLLDSRFLPAIGHHGRAEKRLSSGGRLIRTHERYRSAYKRAIYVARDGRDVAVSLYWQAKRVMGMTADFSDYLALFLQGGLTGADPWHEHVNEWLDAADTGSCDVLVIRYEDMKTAPEDVLRQSARFLGVETSDEAIADAIEAGSMESMKGRESKTKGLAHQETGEKIPVVRKGIVGDWCNYFSDDDLANFIRVAGRAMTRLGYDLHSGGPALSRSGPSANNSRS